MSRNACHPASSGTVAWDDVDLATWRQQCEDLALKTPSLGAFVITLSRDDFRARIDALGDFDTWCQDVALSLDPETQLPRFDWYVIGGDGVAGFANARVIELALNEKKPCFWLRRDGSAVVVRGVRRNRGGDKYKRGFSVVV